VCALFGSPGRAAPLRWADLALRGEGEDAALGAGARSGTWRVGVALDRRRDTAVGAPYALETSPVLFDALTFANIRAVTGTLAEPRGLHLLLAGCRLLASFGAGASRGLGWSEVQATARVDGETLAFDAAALTKLASVPDSGAGDR
jgi:hypothetical protein